VGVHAVPGGVHVRHPGAHPLVDDDRALGAQPHPGGLRERGVGGDTDHDHHHHFDGAVRAGVTLHPQPVTGPVYSRHGRAGDDFYVVPDQLDPHRVREFRVDGGQHLVQRVDLGDPQAAQSERSRW